METIKSITINGEERLIAVNGVEEANGTFTLGTPVKVKVGTNDITLQAPTIQIGDFSANESIRIGTNGNEDNIKLAGHTVSEFLESKVLPSNIKFGSGTIIIGADKIDDVGAVNIGTGINIDSHISIENNREEGISFGNEFGNDLISIGTHVEIPSNLTISKQNHPQLGKIIMFKDTLTGDNYYAQLIGG